MIENISEIKKIRKNLGINQKELAEKAGVSQSLIAKIEAGKIDPTFSRAKQIFQALAELREKEEIKADQVMNQKIVFVKYSEKVKDIIQIMKKKGISQVPVMKNNRVCGLVTESTLLNSLMQDPHHLSNLSAEEVMQEVPPIIPLKTGLKTLLELLKDSPLVLVAEKGDIKGIISKTDLLDKI